MIASAEGAGSAAKLSRSWTASSGGVLGSSMACGRGDASTSLAFSARVSETSCFAPTHGRIRLPAPTAMIERHPSSSSSAAARASRSRRSAPSSR